MPLPNPLEGQAHGDRIGGPIRMALLLGESLVRSIAFAGPANSCPLLEGAFAAASRGVSDVPSCPLELALREPIERVFRALTQTP